MLLPNKNHFNNSLFKGIGPLLAVIFLTVMVAVTGCQTEKGGPNPTSPAMTNAPHSDSIVLREGDALSITFPGASMTLNGVHVISRDGLITMQLVGDIKAAGKTIPQLREELLKAYEKQIDTKEIIVELVSSAFPVYVTGAVLQPGKVMSDHPMSVLEAIMERGGPDYARANLKAVRVLRQEEGGLLKTYRLDLKKVMEAKDPVQFYLRPNDIIYVPERFQMF